MEQRPAGDQYTQGAGGAEDRAVKHGSTYDPATYDPATYDPAFHDSAIGAGAGGDSAGGGSGTYGTPLDRAGIDLLGMDLETLRTTEHPVLSALVSDLQERIAAPEGVALWGFDNTE